MKAKSSGHEARLVRVIVAPDISICDAVPVLDRAGIGILLLCDDNRRLLGVITDGDIRRAILNRISFDDSCIKIASRKPLIASPDVSESEAMRLMDHGKGFLVNHLPVVNRAGTLVDLLLRSDFSVSRQDSLQAVLMAGGYGKRLRPLTDETPKPMLHVGGRPLLEWIIEGLRQSGINRIIITTHYKPEVIRKHFGDGQAFKTQIEYVHEKQPLGTAGTLGLIQPWQGPLLVMNCDIMTRVDYRAMVSYHQEHKADMTVAIREYNVQVPYGIVEMEDTRVHALSEKPSLPFFVNAGIYVAEPVIQGCITSGEYLDMPVLIKRLIDDGRSIVGFPVHEYWIDVGQHTDYEQVQEDLLNGRL